MTRLVLAVLVTLLLGCASAPIEPTYSEQELRATCERHGGWWRPDDLRGGFCEMPGRV